MSGKKIKDAIRSSNPFEMMNNDAPADSSVQNIDATLFGAIEQSDANRQMASPIKVMNIYPDIAQPRRAIPNKVREEAKWDNDNLEDIGVVFNTWERLINDWRTERNLPKFQLQKYLNREVVDETVDIETDLEADFPDEIGMLEKTLIELVELATSIRKDGLANPIAVMQVQADSYIIETGERRWLAYHLLYWHFNEEKFSKIAARTVPELNIWRQAAENNARSNLNAISKARQFAVLLMDLLRQKDGATFTPFSDFEMDSEQAYYAQVEDSKLYRIPHGTSEHLLHATGLKSGKQLRQYRRLLRLPKVVWTMADDLNWTERALRDIISLARDPEELVYLAAKKAEKEGYSVPMGTMLGKPPKKKMSTKKPEKLDFAPSDKRYYDQFLKVLHKARQGREEAVEEAFARIAEIRQWLDDQESDLFGK